MKSIVYIACLGPLLACSGNKDKNAVPYPIERRLADTFPVDAIGEASAPSSVPLVHRVGISSELDENQRPIVRNGETSLLFYIGTRRPADDAFWTSELEPSAHRMLVIDADLSQSRIEDDQPIFLKMGEERVEIGKVYAVGKDYWEDSPMDVCTGAYAAVCRMEYTVSWLESAVQDLRQNQQPFVDFMLTTTGNERNLSIVLRVQLADGRSGTWTL